MNNNCDRTTNNHFLNCPPLMSDGRLFTSYEPHRSYNYKIMGNISAENQNQYRQKMKNEPNLYKSYVNENYDLKQCSNIGLELPPPAKIYRCSKNGCEMYDTNIPNGIGVMNEKQWLEIQKMKQTSVSRGTKCKSFDHIATTNEIRQLNRNNMVSPLDLYYQNQ